MNETKKTFRYRDDRKEGKLILIMALIFGGVSIYLIVLGSMNLGIFTSTLINKALVINSLVTYQSQYEYFLIGSGGLTFTVALAGTRYFHNAAGGATFGLMVLGLLLILLGIYAGYIMSIAGGIVFGLTTGIAIENIMIFHGGRTART